MNHPIFINQLYKTYQQHFWTPRQTVLQGLDLTVEAGEIFGFLGPNGAGKSTTIKAIVGLIQPTAGTVRIFGQDPRLAIARRQVGFLPENPYFYDYLTGREFLRFCGRLFGLSGKALDTKIDGLLEMAGMDDRADYQMRKYSKGMLQRIGLAQSLINDPELVVLDEPLTGLDPLGRAEFKDIILGLKRRGATVFFSSHILPDAETVCDRVAIINQGRLLRTGNLHDLLRTRTDSIEFTCGGIDRKRFDQLRSFALAAREANGEFILQYPDQPSVDRAIKLVGATRGAIRGIVPRQESLESYFAREVGRDGQ
jgi:ABC-2 type transport system ATP-binding protein